MQTRKELIAKIRKDPASTLDDITMLKQELITSEIVRAQLEKRLKIAEFLAERHRSRAEAYRKQLNLAEAVMTHRPH
jgi:capsule polysaccharide export protein KpsE/RkpR